MSDTTGHLEFDSAMRSIGLTEKTDPWRTDWAEALASFPRSPVPFLEPAHVDNACRQLRMSREVHAAILAALPAIASNPVLARLAWLCHHAALRPDRDFTVQVYSWPSLPAPLGTAADFFYAIVYLSLLDHVQQLHRDRAIPAEISLDTLADMELWILDHKQRHGRLGFAQKGWLSLHFAGRLFKLGRLQFTFETFRYDCTAFRHRTRQCVRFLAGNGQRFRRDGQHDGTTGVEDREGAWTSILTRDDTTITGNPIDPRGGALPDRLSLPCGEWKQILAKGDPVLGVHIAATGPMNHEECGESFRRAMEFFPRHFPDKPFRAFTCTSWLLDDQLGQYLPSSSNIVRFQREWYLHPVPEANDFQTFERVFGEKPGNLDDAPQDTALRRIVVQHLKSGGHWRIGGGVIFPDDLNWGAQVYRASNTQE